MFIGIGGGPEGVIAASALDAYGCFFQGRFLSTEYNEIKRAKSMGIKDLNKKYEINEIVSGDAYEKCEKLARNEHIPCVIHVVEMTQPTGHSTSGSHERYKSKERLQWEQDYDCIAKFEEWIIESKIATREELDSIVTEVKAFVKEEKKSAWEQYQAPLKTELNEFLNIANNIAGKVQITELEGWLADLKQSAMFGVFRRDYLSVARQNFSKNR